jgi:DNA-directed RNA polymerase specialized sigma24 family protein
MDYTAAGVGAWLRLQRTPPLVLEERIAERFSYLAWEREEGTRWAEPPTERAALRRLLRELLERELTETERALLLAGAGETLSQRALGRALGIPPSTAARHLAAAQAKLRPLLHAALRYQALLREEAANADADET